MISNEAIAARKAPQIDRLLADALTAPVGFGGGGLPAIASAGDLIERIGYHGVAGLLAQRPRQMATWPELVVARVREQAIALAMWELSHKAVLSSLLDQLAKAGIVAILLKGTALAYDLYSEPATRARGDTDLLVDPADLAQVRLILDRLGFRRYSDEAEPADDFCLQEVWRNHDHGPIRHIVDLHWQVINAPALKDVLPFTECASALRPLPRLSPNAFAMDRVRTLIHTCIHRTMHFTSPYFVDSQVYYGGDRLIWLNDIHLLAATLSAPEWTTLCQSCDTMGVSAACLDGLATAQRFLASPVPEWVCDKLASVSSVARPTGYLVSRQFGRAWQDLTAIDGFKRKLGYLRTRALPPSSFIRGKYPRLAHLPLPLLYARRLLDLVRTRAHQSVSR